MKVKIRQGASISQDFSFFRWPNCKWLKWHNRDPDMVFDAEWNGDFWACTANGFGIFSKDGGEYGNGSIFVHDWCDVEIIEKDSE